MGRVPRLIVERHRYPDMSIVVLRRFTDPLTVKWRADGRNVVTPDNRIIGRMVSKRVALAVVREHNNGR